MIFDTDAFKLSRTFSSAHRVFKPSESKRLQMVSSKSSRGRLPPRQINSLTSVPEEPIKADQRTSSLNNNRPLFHSATGASANTSPPTPPPNRTSSQNQGPTRTMTVNQFAP